MAFGSQWCPIPCSYELKARKLISASLVHFARTSSVNWHCLFLFSFSFHRQGARRGIYYEGFQTAAHPTSHHLCLSPVHSNVTQASFGVFTRFYTLKSDDFCSGIGIAL